MKVSKINKGINFDDKEKRRKLIKKIMSEKGSIVELQKSKVNNVQSSLTTVRKKEAFIPVDNYEDNVLTTLIKKLLKREKIILREKMSFFKSSIEMSNFKRQLRNVNTMSFERFAKWMEILGYDWKLVYQKKKDNKDT